jgi:secondary thiamine-phosphate synthase enzyme
MFLNTALPGDGRSFMDVAISLPTATFSASQISLTTRHAREFIDLTDLVAEHVADTGVRSGLVIVASKHTTAAIVVNEHEPELLKDLNAFLGVLAPESAPYAHNDVPCGPDERPNGHAHCQALLLNTSVSLPIIDGQPLLGRHQRIFLVELDHSRPRTVQVLVMGSGS